MQSRSSRFFIVLLHLVGVSHHFNTEGIVGVQPWPIVLEEVPLGGGGASTSQQHHHRHHHQHNRRRNDNNNNYDPVWLQDTLDGSCFGPTGEFVECGDATLWMVKPHFFYDVEAHERYRRRLRRQKRLRPIRNALQWLKLIPPVHNEDNNNDNQNNKNENNVNEEGSESESDNQISSDDKNNKDQKEEEEYEQEKQHFLRPAGWTFQVVDFEATSAAAESEGSSSSSATETDQQQQNKEKTELSSSALSECLWVDAVTRQVKVQACNDANDSATSSSSAVSRTSRASLSPSALGAAAAIAHARTSRSTWDMSEHSFLQSLWLKQKRPEEQENDEQQRLQNMLFAQKQRRKKAEAETTEDIKYAPAAPLCLWRSLSSRTEGIELKPCNEEDEASSNSQNSRPVQFTLVRYRAVAAPTAAPAPSGAAAVGEQRPFWSSTFGSAASYAVAYAASQSQSTPSESPSEEEEEESTTDIPATTPPPTFSSSNFDKAHQRASEPQAHPKLNNLATKAVPTLPLRPKSRPIDKILKNANPLLFDHQSSSGNGGGGSRRNKKDKKASSTAPVGAGPELPPAAAVGAVGAAVGGEFKKVRRMEIHPYIAAAKDEIWTDPQTGLTYHTDLTTALGRDPQQYGRHTLMGVGQYRKYVIKVYGIAFYVSKRDALADPALRNYAGWSADELRKSQEFHLQLRSMATDDDADGPRFDRTLLLKTNMQLSAETMRSSLGADWKMLTEEAKELLMKSSLEPRPADEGMLKLIQNTAENPSRCSCSQVAPPEYEADPSCCARGTELAFTWLKSGELEVRLNWRVMDVFQRQDIAEGIFFEYLRYDAPMSPEFRERVSDGFPFLLAPLAQVKGVSIGQQQPPPQQAVEPASSGNPVVNFMFDAADAVTSSAMGLGSMVQNGAVGTAMTAVSAAQAVGETAHSVAKEVTRRKDILVKGVTGIPHVVLNILYTPEIVSEWVIANITPASDEEEQGEDVDVSRRDSLGRAFGYPLSRWFSETYQAPDEIGPMKIHPTMNTSRKVFLALVHLYLLLLFIVSFPGSYSTRTKLMVRKIYKKKSFSRGRRSNGVFLKSAAARVALVEYRKPSILKPRSNTTAERLPCDRVNYRGTVGNTVLYTTARQHLRPTTTANGEAKHDDMADDDSATPTKSPLRQKCFSYFL